MYMCFSHPTACPHANSTDSSWLDYVISLLNGTPLQHPHAGKCINIVIPDIYKTEFRTSQQYAEKN